MSIPLQRVRYHKFSENKIDTRLIRNEQALPYTVPTEVYSLSKGISTRTFQQVCLHGINLSPEFIGDEYFWVCKTVEINERKCLSVHSKRLLSFGRDFSNNIL